MNNTNKKSLSDCNKVDKSINLEMLFIYCLVFLLVLSVTGNLCDEPIHTMLASKIDFNNFTQSIKGLSYPIWHICVAFLMKVLFVPPLYAAATINAFFTVSSMIVTRYSLDFFLDSTISRRMKNYITFILTFVSAIYIPWYNTNIYLGQGSINPWHNPTYIAVKPFAIICFLLFMQLYQMDSSEKIKLISKEYKKQTLLFIVFSFFVLFSTFAKPSFLQVFLPTVVFFLLIELIISKGKTFYFSLKTALCFLPVAVVLICQYILVFGSEAATDNKIIFSCFEVWKHFSSNIVLSILLFLAFPIYILIIDSRNIFKVKELLFSIIMVLVGMLEFGLLAESGTRKFDGNFSWGYMLSGLILWITTTVRFLQMYVQDQGKRGYKLKITIGYILLLIHFITGIYYFYLLWNGAVL